MGRSCASISAPTAGRAARKSMRRSSTRKARREHPLRAALLRVDVSKSHEPLDVKAREGGGTYDPFAANAPLTIYASGVRVGYKVLWHSNGHLYPAINGSAAGGNVPPTPLRG